MNDKKAAKKIIRIAKTRPDLYSKADVVYARIIKNRIKENENLTEEKVLCRIKWLYNYYGLKLQGLCFKRT